jgi:cold shock CspA family protein/ribosome-associated translation inhibitor RaiA
MQAPLQITFRNMRHSDGVAGSIEAYVEHLESLYDRITSCRVVVDVPHRHHETGNLYQVSIDLTVPGREIVVNRETSRQSQFKDLEAALGHAFDTAARQLEEFARQRRAHVKRHEPLPHARVARLFPDERYGFIETPDGREIYFHSNSLLNGDFEKLALGTEVTFAEELGDKGPQASTVKIVGRHSHF